MTNNFEDYRLLVGASSQEQLVYDHLLTLVKQESPSQIIERLRVLFVDGIGYPNRQISDAVDELVLSKNANERFTFILNRCCHICINRWQLDYLHQSAIPALVYIFQAPANRPGYGSYRRRSLQRLQALVQAFTSSEQYLRLHRLARLMEADKQDQNNLYSRPLGTFIRRYPYLFEHCLLSEDSPKAHQQSIRQMRVQVQQQFEADLSQYLTHQRLRQARQLVRPGYEPNFQARNENGREKRSLIWTPEQGKTPLPNPTLLEDGELGPALKHFAGKVDHGYTYQERAQHFIAYNGQGCSFKRFKREFYDYLTSSVDGEYGQRKFFSELQKHLNQTLSQCDGDQLNEFLMLRCCSQILNFLVVESARQPEHYRLLDLISNLGATTVTGLVLKVILLCRKVRPYAEKRFSILFNHYESFSGQSVLWLVQALENIKLALCVNFGSIDLGFWAKIA